MSRQRILSVLLLVGMLAAYWFLLAKSQLAKIIGRVKIQGYPDIKPGELIELAGVGDRFNGTAYVTAVRHEIVEGSWYSQVQFGLSPKWFAQQEDIIARTKEDDVEYPSDQKPPTAHIKRVSIEVDGESLKLLRHSMPYGTADEHGLFFIAYAGRPDSFSRMLEAMIVADADGHYDHLMDYTRAVTGATFFAPPLERLGSD